MSEEIESKVGEAIQLVLQWDLPDTAIPYAVQRQAGLLAHLGPDELGASALS